MSSSIFTLWLSFFNLMRIWFGFTHFTEWSQSANKSTGHVRRQLMALFIFLNSRCYSSNYRFFFFDREISAP